MNRTKILYLLFFFPLFSLFSLPGVEYSHLEIPNSSYFQFLSGSQSIHILKIDPSLYEIKPVKALDDGIGRESVLSLSHRYNALAAINGGFFSIGGMLDGKACGTLKIHDWYALPYKARGCIGWSFQDQNPKMDRLSIAVNLNSDQEKIPLEGLNRARKNKEAIVFTPCFHRTTLTLPDGEEIVVVDNVIQSIVKGGSTPIPDRGFVLSIQEKHPLFNTFQVGMPLSFSIQITPLGGDDDWESLDYIVGGTPLLLHPDQKRVDISAEKTIRSFLMNKHARTAVGILPDGHWLFVVVDKTGLFDGMTMNEWTTLLTRLGCERALNLDGGGSSTMVFEGKIQNSPHGDEDEGAGQDMVRRVSDAILVLPKNK